MKLKLYDSVYFFPKGDDDVIGCAVTNAGNVLAFSAKIGGKTSPSIYTDSVSLFYISTRHNKNIDLMHKKKKICFRDSYHGKNGNIMLRKIKFCFCVN